MYSLKFISELRGNHLWIICALPFAGFFIGYLYHHFGSDVVGGNNLVIDEIHDPQKIIPFKMAPLIFITTLITHLFGGSAGREGTAVQMGASLSDQLAKFFRLPFKVTNEERKIILMVGAGAGFASALGGFLSTIFPLSLKLLGALGFAAVFGACANTPIACAIMACELFGFEIGFYVLVCCMTAFYFSGKKGIYSAQRYS